MRMQAISRTTMSVMKIIVMVVGTITLVLFVALAFLAGRIDVTDTVWDLRNRAVLATTSNRLLDEDSTRQETAAVTRVLADAARRERGGAPPGDAEEVWSDMIAALNSYATMQSAAAGRSRTPTAQQQAAIRAALSDLDSVASAYDKAGYDHTASGIRAYVKRLRLLENSDGF